jgi:glycosyltransferase involved in cell wall biosynthesis
VEAFSIVIPTWNNLAYLKLCIAGIRLNSSIGHSIILHINEGKDGTRAWAESEAIPYTFSSENVGICVALNAAAELAKSPYLVYMNDDMYVLPGWDLEFYKKIKSMPNEYWFFSGTMIEPFLSNNPCVLAPYDFGRTAADFQEERLLSEQKLLPQKQNWNGATWPPNIVHKSLWDRVGGYSESFSPGLYSDPDFSMKLWKAGVRHFEGLGSCLVYHFGSVSLSRKKMNDGKTMFARKWGIGAGFFRTSVLKMGTVSNGEALPEISVNLPYVLSVFSARIRVFSKMFLNVFNKIGNR